MIVDLKLCNRTRTAVLNGIEAAKKRESFSKQNTFLEEYNKTSDLFAESYAAKGANKVLRKPKSDYRKAIVYANYIEYRWGIVLANPGIFNKYNLQDFKKEVESLTEFLTELNSENKKETMFNQNMIRIKNSVWQKLQGYHWLSIYLEEIIALEIN